MEPLLAARGYAVRYLDATTDDLRTVDMAPADLLVVLGGPIGAFDDAIYPFIGDELAVILRRLESQRPLLGICLGAQLIARALGAGVASMGVKEIGFAPLTLTPEGEASPLAALDNVPVLHWHGDRFDIPEAHAGSGTVGPGGDKVVFPRTFLREGLERAIAGARPPPKPGAGA